MAEQRENRQQIFEPWKKNALILNSVQLSEMVRKLNLKHKITFWSDGNLKLEKVNEFFNEKFVNILLILWLLKILSKFIDAKAKSRWYAVGPWFRN